LVPEIHEPSCYYQLIISISALMMIVFLIYPIANEMALHIYMAVQKQREKNNKKKMAEYVTDKRRFLDGTQFNPNLVSNGDIYN